MSIGRGSTVAISNKRSRNITVEGHQFKWRATGNDGWISIVIWSAGNIGSRVTASIEYHHEMKKKIDGTYVSKSQLVVTNRIIRAIILYLSADKIVNGTGQKDLGKLEDIIDVSSVLRSK